MAVVIRHGGGRYASSRKTVQSSECSVQSEGHGAGCVLFLLGAPPEAKEACPVLVAEGFEPSATRKLETSEEVGSLIFNLFRGLKILL
jgi:hypothetical protein